MSLYRKYVPHIAQSVVVVYLPSDTFNPAIILYSLLRFNRIFQVNEMDVVVLSSSDTDADSDIEIIETTPT